MADNNPIGDGKSLDLARQLLVVAQEIRNILEQMSGITSRVSDQTRQTQQALQDILENDTERLNLLNRQSQILNKQNDVLTKVLQGNIANEKVVAKIFGTRAAETLILAKQSKLFQVTLATLIKSSDLVAEISQKTGTSYQNALLFRNELTNAAGVSGDLFITSAKLQQSTFVSQSRSCVPIRWVKFVKVSADLELRSKNIPVF